MSTDRRVRVALRGAALLCASAVFACGGDQPVEPPDSADAGSGANGDPARVDGGVDASPDQTAGSRLTPRYAVTTGSDGSVRRQFSGFFDRQRNEPCDIRYEDDGTVQCVPAADGVFELFADASCTQTVWQRLDAADPCGTVSAEPSVFWVYESGPPLACTSRSYYERPSAGPFAPTQLFRSADGSCEPVNIQERSRYYLAPAAPTPIPRSSFVQFASSRVVEGEGRVKVERPRLQGDDGSAVVLRDDAEIVDTVRDVECVPKAHGAAGGRCVPGAFELPAAFTSATCAAESVAYGMARESGYCRAQVRLDSSYQYVNLPGSQACDAPTLHARPTSPPVAPVYDGSPSGTCWERPDDDALEYWPLAAFGAPIDASALAPSSLEEAASPSSFFETPGARLSFGRSVVHAADSTPLDAGAAWFVDAATQTRCELLQTSAGTFCFPGTVASIDGEAFVDAACTEPARLLEQYDSSCDAAHPEEPAFLKERVSACSEEATVYAAPAPLEGGGYVRDSFGACVACPREDAQNERWFSVYRASDLRPVDLSKLVKLTYTEEY